MRYRKLHKWKVSPREASLIQKRLAEKIVLKTSMSAITKIAACDVGFTPLDRKHLTGLTDRTDKVVAAVVVFSFPQLKLLEKVIKTGRTNYSYIPGLLTFREGPILLKAFSHLKNRPDLAIFDGQGIAHPRRMGLATHMGILLDISTIGCAKTPLYGKFRQPPHFKGGYSYIQDNNGKTIGAAVRTREDVRCVFISAGYKISLQTATKTVLACSSNFRIPEPLKVAHRFTQI